MNYGLTHFSCPQIAHNWGVLTPFCRLQVSRMGLPNNMGQSTFDFHPLIDCTHNNRWQHLLSILFQAQ
jgi:hypothetical protein